MNAAAPPAGGGVPAQAHAQVADADLLAAWRAGDVRAFDLLYDRYRLPVYGFLVRLLGDRVLADDVHQDLWLQVIERGADFRTGGNVRTWLFTLARSRALDRLRREAVRDGARGRDRDARAGRGDADPARGARGSSGHGVAADAGDPAATPADLQEQARLQGERAALLQGALAQLPEDQRSVFLLREEGELSLPEAASVLGIPYETAKSRYRYALARLRDYFGIGTDGRR
jgi:RNA polymerase sigma-70 factor (ECF subfamily)